jgi:hypothetical protein
MPRVSPLRIAVLALLLGAGLPAVGSAEDPPGSPAVERRDPAGPELRDAAGARARHRGSDRGGGFRRLSPEERQRVLEDFQRWSELPEERRRELQAAYDRFVRLPPERRERILQRFRELQALPAAERERIMQNWARWRQLSPEERGALRARWERLAVDPRP